MLMPDRRNGSLRGMYNRLAAGDRFASRATLNEVQFRLNTILSPGDFSANQLAFGPNPTDLSMWHDGNSVLEFAHDASLSAQVAQKMGTADAGTGSDPKGDS